jgi:hypothetical protein
MPGKALIRIRFNLDLGNSFMILEAQLRKAALSQKDHEI